jgi:hypothetical protein
MYKRINNKTILSEKTMPFNFIDGHVLSLSLSLSLSFSLLMHVSPFKNNI